MLTFTFRFWPARQVAGGPGRARAGEAGPPRPRPPRRGAAGRRGGGWEVRAGPHVAAAARPASPARRRPRELQTEQTRGAGLPASAPGPPSPARHGGRPASPQPRGRRLAGRGGRRCLTLSRRVQDLCAAGRRMSPWGWLLLPTLCLLPTGAAPPRGAPASANCELKPQVGRASGVGTQLSRTSPGGLPSQACGAPRARIPGHLPLRLLFAGASAAPRGPLSGGGAVP